MELETLIRQLHRQARLAGACKLFTGRERTMDELLRLFHSPQGVEFCTSHSFPQLPVLRQLAAMGLGPDRGVYIDAGQVQLQGRPRLLIAGRTTATIDCAGCERFNIVLMHGARAVVNATDWAVVHVEAQRGCPVIRNVTNNAIML